MNRQHKRHKAELSATPSRVARRGPPVSAEPARANVLRSGNRLTFSWLGLWFVVALIALNVFIYEPVRHYDFVAYDDPAYVSENPNISRGLTWPAVIWAFTAEHAGYWIPLTWLSYMADVQIAGMNAGSQHLTNLILHVANSLLLFLLLLRMTGALGKSAFVAALFAVHPLHVESVAWITERKDVLSTCFLMLTLWAYVSYVRRPGVGRYVVVLLWFTLGLLAKPMLVTVPFLLLLLDVWPLQRWALSTGTAVRPKTVSPRERRPAAWLLVWEKVPLLILAAAASIVTMQAQRNAVTGLDLYPLGLRVGNALVAYLAYIGKMFWPAGLAVLYPYPSSLPGWKVAGSAVILAGIAVVVMRSARRYPYLAIGWLWYLGTLVPVIGLVQVGVQSMADRFTYIPLIGIFIILAWGIPEMLNRRPVRQRVIPVVAALAILALTITARGQVRYWQDSVSLWTHTIEVTMDTDQYHAHMALGRVLRGQGRLDESFRHFSEAMRLKPDSAEAKHGLGQVLADQGKIGEAFALLSEAVRLQPDLAEARNDLCLALMLQGNAGEAVGHCTEAVRLRPDSAEARNNLGMVLSSQGRSGEAVLSFAEALRLKPDFAQAHVNLGAALASQGKVEEAIAQYAEALRINPSLANVHNNLGALLAGQGKVTEASSQFSEAVRLNPGLELAHMNLGMSMARAGRRSEALHEFEEVLRINPGNELARRAVDDLARKGKQ